MFRLALSIVALHHEQGKPRVHFSGSDALGPGKEMPESGQSRRPLQELGLHFRMTTRAPAGGGGHGVCRGRQPSFRQESG